jgi:hypothetical protein
VLIHLAGHGYLERLTDVLVTSYDIPSTDALRKALRCHQALFATEPVDVQVRIRGGHEPRTSDYVTHAVPACDVVSLCAGMDELIRRRAAEPRGRPPLTAWAGRVEPWPWPWSQPVLRPIDAARALRERAWPVLCVTEIYGLIAGGQLTLPTMPSSLVTELGKLCTGGRAGADG